MPNYVDTYRRPAFSWMEKNRGNWEVEDERKELGGKEGEAVAGMSNREMNK